MTIFINTSDDSYFDAVKSGIESQQVIRYPESMSRMMQLKNARRGSILISDDEKDKNSPLYVGDTDKTIEQIQSSANWAINRLEFFNSRVPAKILGRTYSDPINILIGDPDGIDPRQYVDIFPDNWWGSCAYLEEYDPKKLFTILEMYLYYTKPVAVTDKAAEALKAIGLDFVDARAYNLDRQGGLLFREHTRRSESFDFLLEERDIDS